MLLAFIAFIALVNALLNWIGQIDWIQYFSCCAFWTTIKFSIIIGYVLQLVAYGIGVPWQDSLNFGSLFGTKIVLNEFVAYSDMGKLVEAGKLVNEKSIIMANLCFMWICKLQFNCNSNRRTLVHLHQKSTRYCGTWN